MDSVLATLVTAAIGAVTAIAQAWWRARAARRAAAGPQTLRVGLVYRLPAGGSVCCLDDGRLVIEQEGPAAAEGSRAAGRTKARSGA